jgi:hypothetical protein
MNENSGPRADSNSALSIANIVIGVAGIIVGIVGIYFTVIQSPSALNALGEVVSGTKLPAEFQGLAGRMQIFFLAFLSAISFLVLLCGIAIVFRYCLILLGNRFPWHSALLAVMGLVLVGLSAALIGISAPAVAFFLVQALSCFVILLFLTSQEGVWDAKLGRLKLGSDLGAFVGLLVVGSVCLGMLVAAIAGGKSVPTKPASAAVTEPNPTAPQ